MRGGADVSEARAELCISPLSAPHAEALTAMKAEVATLLAEAPQNSVVSDSNLIRFLRGWSWDVPKCCGMFREMMAWRAERGMDAVRDLVERPDFEVSQLPHFDRISALAYIYQGSTTHHDRNGKPLLVEKPGSFLPVALFAEVSEEDATEFFIAMMEHRSALLHRRTQASGYLERFCVIMDFDGMSTQHLWREGIEKLRRMMRVSQDYYPETSDRLIVIRPPAVFAAIWTIVTPWLAPRTRKKLVMVSGSDPIEELSETIDAAMLPSSIGGPKACPAFERLNSTDVISHFHVARGQVVTRAFALARGARATWKLRMAADDVLFAVDFQRAAEAEAAEAPLESVVTKLKRDAHDGAFVAGGGAPGTLTFTFSNAHAWWKSKTVVFEVLSSEGDAAA
jgi:hypothetical protein